jgi:hypothetical protein
MSLSLIRERFDMYMNTLSIFEITAGKSDSIVSVESVLTPRCRSINLITSMVFIVVVKILFRHCNPFSRPDHNEKGHSFDLYYAGVRRTDCVVGREPSRAFCAGISGSV